MGAAPRIRLARTPKFVGPDRSRMVPSATTSPLHLGGTGSRIEPAMILLVTMRLRSNAAAC
ncbi:Uncharacterised protein [Mycobacteroides abscessus subsp. abscessus]|nr:Uncharacterised protein [Mycobacteroides abscessus subsp. abscessus]